MTDDKRDLDALNAAATQGEWVAEGVGSAAGDYSVSTADSVIMCDSWMLVKLPSDADAAFIVALRNAYANGDLVDRTPGTGDKSGCPTCCADFDAPTCDCRPTRYIERTAHDDLATRHAALLAAAERMELATYGDHLDWEPAIAALRTLIESEHALSKGSAL